ncbi:hypothetical protein TWF481_010372 [Arthrobotrys musiformis]|uniref:Uncharacterized protein n=1 Tax=Arthrobotrys musiformis TaxID=47236 RepID=A0AAV9W0J2_9PEZI
MAQQPHDYTRGKKEPESPVALRALPEMPSNTKEWTPLQEASFRVAYATYHFIWLTGLLKGSVASDIETVLSAARIIARIQFSYHVRENRKPYTEVTLKDLLSTFDISWFSALYESYGLGGPELRGDQCAQRVQNPKSTTINTTYSKRGAVDGNITSIFTNLLCFVRNNPVLSQATFSGSNSSVNRYLQDIMDKFSIKTMEHTITGFRKEGTLYATSTNLQPWVDHLAAFKFLVKTATLTSKLLTNVGSTNWPLLRVLQRIMGPMAIPYIFSHFPYWYLTASELDDGEKILGMLLDRTPHSSDVALQLDRFLEMVPRKFLLSQAGEYNDPATTLIFEKLFKGVIQDAFKSHPKTHQDPISIVGTENAEGKEGKPYSDGRGGRGLRSSDSASLKRKADEEPRNLRSNKKRGGG